MNDNTTEILTKEWNRSKIIWKHGLISATILGVAHSIPAYVVAPEVFNFSKAGIVKLVSIILASGILGACTYLIKSPLPPLPKELKNEETNSNS